MVVALIALVVACAGTATAATVLIRSSSQIGNGVIRAQNIHPNTITGRQIQNGSIGNVKLANGSVGPSKLSSKALKALGSGGATSGSSAAGSALEWDRGDGPDNVAVGQPSQRVMTVDNIPAGVYAIFADTNLSDTSPPGSLFQFEPTADAQCSISADADIAYGSNVVGGSFFAGSGNVTMQITHTFTGTGTITMDCSSSSAWNASGSSIIAIRLSSAPKMAIGS